MFILLNEQRNAYWANELMEIYNNDIYDTKHNKPNRWNRRAWWYAVRTASVCVPKSKNTIDINISMRARIQIIPKLCFLLNGWIKF